MSRPKLVTHRVTTGWVALGMVSSGVAHVLRVPASLEGFAILGAIALLAPGFPRLKEWADAGITIDLTGAAFAWSVVGAGDAASTAGHIAAPLVGLALTAASWALRPDSRRLPDAVPRRSHRSVPRADARISSPG